MAAGQSDAELLCPIRLLFGRATMLYPKIPLLWVVDMGLKARDSSGWGIRSGRTGVDVMEMVTKRVQRSKNDQANIGVVRYDIGISDLHPQLAKGDGRTLISIGG
jgi:hypothetical protein